MPKKINSFHYDSLKIKGVYISNSIEKYKCFDKKRLHNIDSCLYK